MYRTILKVFQGQPYFYYIYSELLARVYVADSFYIFPNGQELEIKKGQVLTSYRRIADELNLSRKSLSKALDLMEEAKLIIKSRHQNYALITLPFMEVDEKDPEVVESLRLIGCSLKDQLSKNSCVSETPQDRHQRLHLVDIELKPVCLPETHPMSMGDSTKEEDSRRLRKEIKNKRKDTTVHAGEIIVSELEQKTEIQEHPKPHPSVEVATPNEATKMPPPDEVMQLAIEWIGYANLAASWRHFNNKDQLRFAEGIEKTMASRDINVEGMRAVLKYVSDPECFWFKNAISPGELCRKKAGKELAKIDHILMSMRNSRGLKDAQTMQVAQQIAKTLETGDYEVDSYENFLKRLQRKENSR